MIMGCHISHPFFGKVVGCPPNGADDAGMSAAAAEIAIQGLADLLVGWLPVAVQEGGRGHHHAVDTVAAGDCFNGCLATALAEGQDLRVAIRFASAAAAISVTRRGAQPSLPHREEIAEKLKSS